MTAEPSTSPPTSRPSTWLIDLDGVIWNGSLVIPGGAAAVATLRADGVRVLFVTNHSSPRRHDLLSRLADADIPAVAADIVTSADAAASLLDPRERVLIFGGPGVVEAARAARASIVESGPADAVIVGWHDDLSFEGLTTAVRTVLDGARLIATNDDPIRPEESGPVPGTGALVAAVEAATGRTAQRAGKPHEPIAELVRARVLGETIVVGDSPQTDGRLAAALGATFVLVMTGVTKSKPTEFADAIVTTDLFEAVRQAHR